MTNFLHFHVSKLLRMTGPVLLIAMAMGLAACSSGTEVTTEAESADADPDRAVEGGAMPEGWSVRADNGDGSDINFTMEGETYHFQMGSAGTFYNPAWTATGDRKFSATLTQTAKPTHPISYGIMAGGMNLDGENQMYTYFLVRNNGQYYIANRDGAAVTKVVDWTANPAINAEAADGTQTNTLGIEVAGNNVIFTVNGMEVDRRPKADLHVDGMYGFRIGHNLDVDVSNVMN